MWGRGWAAANLIHLRINPQGSQNSGDLGARWAAANLIHLRINPQGSENSGDSRPLGSSQSHSPAE